MCRAWHELSRTRSGDGGLYKLTSGRSAALPLLPEPGTRGAFVTLVMIHAMTFCSSHPQHTIDIRVTGAS